MTRSKAWLDAILIRTIIFYALATGLWFCLTDLYEFKLVLDLAQMQRVSMLKDLLYVIVSSLLLYLLLRYYVARINRSAEELQESATRYTTLIDNSRDGIYIQGAGCFQYLNHAACVMFGVQSPEDLIGTKIIDRCHPDYHQKVLERIRVINEERLPVSTVNEKCLRIDGTCFDIDLHAVPFMHNGVNGALVYFRDISRRKRAEEEARRERELTRLLLDSIPNPAFLITRNRRIKALNSAGKAFGAKEGDYCWCGIHSCEAVSQADREAFESSGVPLPGTKCHFCLADEAVQRHETAKVDVPLDGKTWETCWTPVDDEIYLHYAIDITERKRTEEALRVSEEKYRDIFNSMIDGFSHHEIILDDRGAPVDYRFLAVNPAFERLTDLKAVDLIGRTVLEVLPGTEREWIERYGRVALTGESMHFDQYSRELGRFYEVSAYRPAPGQFACILVDITEQKHLEEQLRQSHKMESIGTLAGGVAHDFNNILTVIMGACTMLNMKIGQDEELEPFLSVINSSSERAAKLTHDLLAFSRKQTIRPRPVDINDIVMAMSEFLERIIGEDIVLERVLSHDPMTVFVDRGQIEQVLMNLATNARDAMPHGGRLRIETSLIESSGHAIEQEGCLRGTYALVAVTDTGIGMDQTTQDRIFEPFFTTKEMGRGTGLGLSMAYGIIRQHDGVLLVESEPSKGTVFKIYLPLSGAFTKEETVEQNLLMPSGSETILLVEDDADVRIINAKLLQHVGYTVLTAENGTEAMQHIERHGREIRLAILDVIMPGMNGKEIHDSLKMSHPDIKVLFFSGYSADKLHGKGIIAEDVNFISKPLEHYPFLARVRELLDN